MLPVTDTVRLEVLPHPFATKRVTHVVEPGASLRGTLESCGYDQRVIDTFSVCLDGVPIPPERWDWLYPEDHSLITVRAVPQGGGGGGGGKNVFRIVAMIAVIAVAAYAAAALGPALASALGGAIAEATAASLIFGVVSFAGQLLINALIPPPRAKLPSLPSFSASNAQDPLVPAITGTSNRPNRYGAIPRIYGTHKVFPALGALPYTEIAGNDQYLRMFFVVGYGPVDITDIRIGETSLGTFTDVQTEILYGDPATDPPLTLYTNNVKETSVNVELKSVDPFTERTTDIDAEEISVDIAFLRGLVQFDNQGNKQNRTVSVNVEYRLVGGTWQAAPNSPITATDKTTSTVRKTLKWSVTKGQYEVRLQRTTPDSSSTSVFDSVFWVVLRTFEFEAPINDYSNLAVIALRGRATNQFQGVIDQLNCVVTAKLPTYDGTAWTAPVATNNPAWAYVDAFTGSANLRPIPLSRIDAVAMKAWADANDTAGREYNFVHDTPSTLFDTVKQIAAVGRASFHIQDGQYTVVRDIQQSIPVQHLTPRNSWGYEAEKVFIDQPHALKVQFLDQDRGYQQSERIVYDDGYDATNATKFETLSLPGVTDSDQAWKDGRYHIAVARLRPELHALNVDIEHLVCTRGDLVMITHDVPQFGLGFGRITNVTTSGTDVTGIDLDASVTMAVGPTYVVRMRGSVDGETLLHAVDTVVGEQTSLTFTTPIPNTQTQPQADDLWMFGETNKESVDMLVKSIEPFDGVHARLVCVDAAPAVHTADTGAIPPFDPQISVPVPYERKTPPVPVISMIRSDESVLTFGPDGSLRSRILVSLTLPSSVSTENLVYQAQFRQSGSTGLWNQVPAVPVDAGEISIEPVRDGVSYDLRFRTLRGSAIASAWTTESSHVVIGKSSPPPDVNTFVVDRQADGTREFSWTMLSEPPDMNGFKIKWKLGTGHAWADLSPLHTGLIQASPFETNQLAAGTYTIGIKAVDTSGNESANAKIIQSTIGDPRLAGAILQVNVRAAGWSGTKSSCFVENGDLVADDTKTWDDFDLDLITWDDWLTWGRVPANPITYEHTVVDLGAILTVKPLVTVTGPSTGVATIEESHSDDDVTYSSFAPISTGQITARYFKIKVSMADTDPFFETMTIIMDADATVEEIQDLDSSTVSSPAGDLRLPLNKSFSIITSVNLALQNVGAGWSWEIIDKDATNGPRVKIYNASDTLADATIDAVVRGVE